MEERERWYHKYKVKLPAGKSGDWEVKQFEVSEEASLFDQMKAASHGSRRFVPAGTYTGLFRRGAVWMSDTPDEIKDHLEPIRIAELRGGHCLINGLGLGVVTIAMLNKPKVTKVTVIEIDPDVIKLVGPAIQEIGGDAVEIIQADAYTWQPPKSYEYSVVWHDIWQNLCDDNLEEMAKLHRKYGRRCGWQGSWGRELLKYNRRRERRQERWW